MQNLLMSVTGAVCAVFDTVANTADAVNGISEAARLRSESFARITASQVELKEREAEFELDIATQQLDRLMADPSAIEELVRKRRANAASSSNTRSKVQRPVRKPTVTPEDLNKAVEEELSRRFKESQEQVAA